MTTETHDYDGPERRKSWPIPEDVIEDIAERAAKKAIEQMTAQAYQAIGKGVVTRALWLIGLLATGLVMYFTGKGDIKL